MDDDINIQSAPKSQIAPDTNERQGGDPQLISTKIIADRCKDVAKNIDEVTSRVSHRIRERLPSYSAVPIEQHRNSTRQQLLSTLEYVAKYDFDAESPREDLESARQIGRERALQGMPLSDVIESFHIGSRELWRSLLEQSPTQIPELLETGGMLWDLMHARTREVALGHNEATRTAHAVRANQRSLLFDLLERGEDGDELRSVAHLLGFDPEGEFRAVCTAADTWTEEHLQNLQAQLDDGHGGALSIRRDAVIITVFQHADSSEVIGAIRKFRPGASVGIGLTRRHILGASVSITDARRALALTRGRKGTIDFEASWLPATLSEHWTELDPILGIGFKATENHPHIAEAVREFAANGFSVSAAARALHLHTNSLAYRLERWHQLTGWDTRTIDGLVKSALTTAIPAPPDSSKETR